jgi:hypothetical protein
MANAVGQSRLPHHPRMQIIVAQHKVHHRIAKRKNKRQKEKAQSSVLSFRLSHTESVCQRLKNFRRG